MESLITHLIGGLGNQMFQYAAGYALSKRLGVALKFDISDFKEYKLHNGLEILRIFNCPFEYASKFEIEAILGRRTNFRLPDKAKLIAYNLLFPRHILIDRYRIGEHFQMRWPQHICVVIGKTNDTLWITLGTLGIYFLSLWP